jgi:hypothetical protein
MQWSVKTMKFCGVVAAPFDQLQANDGHARAGLPLCLSRSRSHHGDVF